MRNFAGMMDIENLKQLTRAETALMNLLWDQPQGLTVVGGGEGLAKGLVERHDEPRPARTTVATFLKILEAKGYVEHRRLEGTGRTFVYSPLLTREKYVTFVLREVRDTVFGSSTKKMLSFFIEHEELSDEELQEIMELIR